MGPIAKQATSWAKKGYDAQLVGHLVGAELAYRQALDLQPDHPVALQLLGLLLRKRGDLPAAEALMRQSLKAQAGQPHVWNNLGNLLEDFGRMDEALDCFHQALVFNPNYADAHFNRARLLHQLKHPTEAALALLRAIEIAGQATVAMLQLQAMLQSDAGYLNEALATLDEALALKPDKPALLHNRATLLQRCHRHAEALIAHDKALAMGLDAADAHYNRGNTLQSLGRLDDATLAYRAALALAPLHRLALLDLARLRWRLGDPDFDQELRHVSQSHLQVTVGPALRGELLMRAERFEEAAADYAEAIRRDPNSPAFHDGRGRCLVRLGRLPEGLACHSQALALAPEAVQLHINQASSLLVAQQVQAAEDAAQAALRLSPQDQNAWALQGTAWRLMGDPREAWLNDYARFVGAVDVDVPEGFADMASFHCALEQELSVLHFDRTAPIDQSLRHGTQTLGDIFDQGLPLVNALKAKISQAIDRYIADLPHDKEHPFLGRRSAAWRFTDSWSSLLRPRGYHTNHVHPHGWISSAYYVTVPQACADASKREGWLQFGQADMELGGANAARHWVQPAPGRLVLFPSMFWHGTVPFEQDATRLTIAFDVLPR
jgi:uncharacterized protein (TIGR02466 family)